MNDEENSLDYRLDAGPPLKPEKNITIVLVTIPLEKITDKIKRFWEWVKR